MRALIVTNIPTPYNDALFRHLYRQRELELLILYCANTESQRAWEPKAHRGYPHRFLSGRDFGVGIHVNPGMAGAVRRYRPDIAVLSGSYLMPSFVWALAGLASCRCPWLYWGEELSWIEEAWWRRSLLRVARHPLVRAERILAVGIRAAESYAKLGIDRSRIVDFHYYPDVEAFQRYRAGLDNQRLRIRKLLGYSSSVVVLLFCGQLIHRKGADILLRACAIIRDQGREFRLLLVGDGPEAATLRDLSKSLGIEQEVSFVGFVQPEDLPGYFSAADVCVVPSRKEGWGVVVGEAMAAGLPIVASDQVNAALDLVDPGEMGLIFPNQDVRALADGICELAECPTRIQRMSHKVGRAALHEHPRMGAKKMHRVLREVLERPT
jgi:glycosyltransferase involved in cell wall biosynthesis